MIKITTLLLLVASGGHCSERRSKQYVFSVSNYPVIHQENPRQTQTLTPYSNSYPFYALWNNVANGGRPFSSYQVLAPGSINNQISSMPEEGSRNTYHSSQQQLSKSPLVVPFATISEAYDNLWNYDLNSLRPKIHAVTSENHLVQNDVNNFQNDGEHGEGHDHKSFNREHVESIPYSSSAPQEVGANPRPGFIREHIESRPEPEIILGMRNMGFIRGAVESSDLLTSDRRDHNRIIRYDAASESTTASSPSSTTTSNKVVCYFASWSFYRKGKGSFTPENVNPSLCTHVVYAFANLDKSKFAIKESDPQLDKDQQFYKRVVALKQRNPNLKVLLGLGGWSDSGDDKYSVLANSPENRRKFAQDAVKFLKDRNFDGLSFDWHYPKCWQSQCDLGPDSDKQAFSLLLKELKATFQPEGLVLSATLSGYKEVVDLAYDIPSLSQHLDLMNVMSYDYHGAWESRTGHLAPLFAGPPSFDPYPSYNVNYTIQYYLSKGADKSKLVVGVPFYGQTFHLGNAGDTSYGSEAQGPGVPGDFTQQPGMLAYYEICARVKNKQWTVKYDRTGSWGPYAYKDSEWVGYDDQDFLTRKARYVKQEQLGGMFVWTMDLDDFQNECCTGSQPLLRTIAKELLGIEYDPNAVDCTAPVVPKPAVEITTMKPGHEGETIRPTTDNSHETPSTLWPHTTTSSMSTTVVPPPPTTTIDPSTTQNLLSSTTAPDSSTSHVESSSVVFICHQVNGTVPKPETTQPSTMRPSTIASTRPPTQVVVPASTCDNTWIYKPDPMDCSMYWECHSSKSTKKKCPQGLHWNQYAHTCDWPEYAQCKTGPSMQTTGSSTTTQATPWTTMRTTTTQAPRPTRPPMTNPPTTTYRPIGSERCNSGEYSPGPSCDQFYVCVSGTQTLQSCGPGLHWNAQKKLCDWPNSANCENPTQETIKFPKNCRDGEFFPSEEDCEVYYLCNHGQLIQFRCSGGLYWNQNAKLCDWPQNVGCQASGPQTRPPTTTTAAPIYTDPTTARPQPTTKPSTTTARPQPTTRPTTEASPVTSTAVSTSTMGSEVVVPEEGANSKDFMIVCYFTNWAWYRPGIGKYKPENIDPSLCTHIVYGFAVLDYTELVLKPHDTWADYDNHFYEQVTEFKKRGTKVTLAIGGWNDSQGDKYSRLVNNPASRQKFIKHAIEFIKKHNFDGLDLDWEYPVCWQVECDKGPASDKSSFAEFTRELKEAFRPHGLLLSAAVSPSKLVIDKGYDVPTIARSLDWIAVMTYDFHGQWDKKTGHVAPLYFHEEDDFAYFNANYSINYWINQGADRKKIVMGMPLYGQSFTLANPNEHGLNAPSVGGGTAGEFTRASGFLSYYEICHNVQKDGWTVVQDETGAMGPYAYKGNQWVSYDDVAMIRKKSQLIRDLNLGGGMIWALDLDDFRNTCGQGAYPLLTTIKNVLGQPRISDDHEQSASTTDKIEVPMSTSTQRQITTRHTTTTTTTARTTKKPGPTTKKPVVATVETEDAIIIGEQEAGVISQQKKPPVASVPPTKPPKPFQKADCNAEPFRPHDTDCNKYMLCLFGNYVEQSCPAGTYWNKDHCDWTCGSEPTGAGTTSTTMTPHRPTPAVTTTTQRPWTPSSSMMTTNRNPTTTSTTGPWTPTTTKPSTSTSWEWKPPIITTTTIDPIDVPDSDFMVVCYFTNWAWYRQGIGKYKPEDIDYNLCTHIAYGFAVLNPSTLEIRTHDSWADVDNSFYKLVTDIKQKGKKVVIAIGGWNDSLGDKYSRLVRDPAARKKFIDNVIAFIQKYNFDGLDLDWEYPTCWQTDCKKGPASDKENFATFVKELKEAFKPHGFLLSSAVTPSKTIIDAGYDVPIINQYLDWIAVMTYDYHGQWDKKTGHVAPLYHHEESDNFYFNSNYTINYWISQGADKKKLVMGMPMYGQSFTLTQASNNGLNSPSTGGGQAGEFTRAQGFLAYYEICQNIKNKGWTVVQDETGAIGPYAYKGDQWVSFDDVAMIRRKSQYIKDLGLGGGMIWALDLDDFRNVCGCEKHPLLKTINRVLRNYPEPEPQCKL